MPAALLLSTPLRGEAWRSTVPFNGDRTGTVSPGRCRGHGCRPPFSYGSLRREWRPGAAVVHRSREPGSSAHPPARAMASSLRPGDTTTVGAPERRFAPTLRVCEAAGASAGTGRLRGDAWPYARLAAGRRTVRAAPAARRVALAG